MPTPRRIVVCPQEFKGSLDASAAARAIATGIHRVVPEAEIILHPMADGGPGTMEIIAAASAARIVEATVSDPYGRPVLARYALIESASGPPAAVIESAAAVALAATAPADRAPLRSTSRGVGELIRHAALHGSRSVILGVGGTASSDGGAGAARALGLRLLDAGGDELPEEAIHLSRLAVVQARVPDDVQALTVRIAVDVRNRLSGADGAVAIFGAQKSLKAWQAPALDAAITRWATVVREQLRREIAHVEGAGAGGGIPAGILAALPRATIESGAALVAEVTGLEAVMAGADLVVTGEGALDAQTAFGKAVAHVALLAGASGVPCLAVAGTVEALPEGIADAEPLARTPAEVEAAIAHATSATADAAERLMRRWIAGSGEGRA